MRIPIQARPIERMRHTSKPSRRTHGGSVMPQDGCSVCTDVLAGVIYTAANGTCWLGCTGVGIAAGAACEVAFLGPEDPIGDVVCPILDATLDAICEQFGCDSLKSWSGAQSAAQQICAGVHIC